MVSMTIDAGGSALIDFGGTDSATTILAGGFETVSGTVTGDAVYGTQLVSFGSAVTNDETVYSGGAIDLFLKGGAVNSATVLSGGTLAINGNASATDTTLSAGALLDLQSPKATLDGTVTFDGAATLQFDGLISAGYGDLALISGFGAGSIIDERAIGSGATLTTATSGSNTVATITSGGTSESVILAGSVSSLGLLADSSGGVELVYGSGSAGVSSGGSSSGSTVIVSGGTSTSDTTISGGTTIEVESGGTMVSMTVANGGSALIAFGGVDSGTTILSGGFETVSGTANGDAVYGTQLVSFGSAVANDETVNSGGTIDLFLKGGAVNSTTVLSGGTLAISGNASATDTTLSAGALLDLQSPKATLEGTVTFDGAATIQVDVATDAGYGSLAVISGFGDGSVIDERGLGTVASLTTATSGGDTVATITGTGGVESFTFAGTLPDLGLLYDNAGGVELVYGSGTASVSSGGSSPLSSGSTVIVSGGTSSAGALIPNGVTLLVQSGGTAISAVIGSGGTALISGLDSGSVINSGGFENVSGQATGDGIYGTQLVSYGTASVSNETVNNGGTIDLFLKGVQATDIDILGGGTLAINGNIQAKDTTLNSAGLLDLQSPKAALTGGLTFTGPATLEFDAVASAGFGDLAIISGFGSGSVIDERAIGSGATLSTVSSGGVTTATITSGGTTETLTFAGAYTSGLVLGPDTVGGVELTYVPCFAAGTRIRTDRGETAIEDLAKGDLVLTPDGEALPVVWVGSRTVDCARHPAPETVMPVRIRAHAFGPGLPARDLLLSPDHAVYAEAVLIPVKHLINGSSVRQIAVPRIAYYHVELPRHAILQAEGLPAESYLDSGDRGSFANGGDGVVLHPVWGGEARDVSLVWDACGAAPLCVTGPLLDRVRAVLAERVSVLGEGAAA
jgi:autotransporter passenger strand-loop-strand repeat protein